MTSARLWLSFAGGAGIFVALSVGACRKPGPDEIVYTGANRSPSDSPSQGGSSSTTGGSSGTSGASSGTSSGGRGGTTGDSGTGGRDPSRGGGGNETSEGGAGAGGEAGTPDPCPTVPVGSGTFTKRALLEALAACSVRETCVFQGHAKTLRDRAATAASEPSEAATAAAREAWLAAMASWEGLELFQFGPAAAALNPGGRGFRDLIYSWPAVARCKVNEQTVNRFYASESFFGSTSTSVTSGRTLHALEYLLFYPGMDNGCTAYSTINSTRSWSNLSPRRDPRSAARLRGAGRRGCLGQAEALSASWNPDGGDFTPKLVEKGPVYASEQAALNAVSNALFYVEKEVKDFKLALPLGLDPTCPAPELPRPGRVALRPHVARPHRARTCAASASCSRAAATATPGFGFDDWLVAVGAQAISRRACSRRSTEPRRPWPRSTLRSRS